MPNPPTPDPGSAGYNGTSSLNNPYSNQGYYSGQPQGTNYFDKPGAKPGDVGGLGGAFMGFYGSVNNGPNGSMGFGGTDANGNPMTGQWANYYQGMGSQAMGQQAAQADYTAGNQSLGTAQQAYGQAQSARTSQGDSLNLLASAAEGKQPSAAQIQMQQGVSAAARAQLAAAASARGGAYAQSAAQNAAAQQGAQMQSQAVGQGAQLRAQEMAQARDAYMRGATTLRQSDLAGMQAMQNQAQIQNQMTQYNAGLSAQQQQANEQQQLAYQQLGFNTMNAQLGADEQTQQLQAQAQEDNAQRAQQSGSGILGGLMSGIGGMMMMSDRRIKYGVDSRAADLHLKEPGGPDHWRLREEKNFILAMNMRTGQKLKLQMAPLTAAEEKEVDAPHGAGPLDRAGPHDRVAGDLDMGNVAGSTAPVAGAQQTPYGMTAPPQQPGAVPGMQTQQPGAMAGMQMAPMTGMAAQGITAGATRSPMGGSAQPGMQTQPSGMGAMTGARAGMMGGGSAGMAVSGGSPNAGQAVAQQQSGGGMSKQQAMSLLQGVGKGISSAGQGGYKPPPVDYSRFRVPNVQVGGGY